MRIKWRNVLLVALAVVGIWLWRHAPEQDWSWPAFHEDVYVLAWRAMAFIALVGIVKLLTRSNPSNSSPKTPDKNYERERFANEGPRNRGVLIQEERV